ncbi:MAG: excinuclease ABC subunit UvrA [Candidatus Absconditabacterales bacterium]
MNPASCIIFQGIKTHNLKNIDLELPKNQMITITGVSGSGKSSLAFDTIYKEGQFRYIESLSSYLRQFFNLGERPEIDYCSGLSPAIAIEQNKRIGNSRSSVGTLTEIDDYLRLLFAKLGDSYCYNCGKIIKPQTIEQIMKEIEDHYIEQKIYLLQESGILETKEDLMDFVKKNRNKVEKGKGFTRYLLVAGDAGRVTSNEKKSVTSEEGRVTINEKKSKNSTPETTNSSLSLEPIEYFYLETPNVPKEYFPLNIYGIYDRVTVEEQKIGRLKEDIIKILGESKKFGIYITEVSSDVGRVMRRKKKLLDSSLETRDSLLANFSGIRRFTDKMYCPDCNVTYPEFTPQHFSPNRQEGACTTCHGIGEILQVDFDKILDPISPYMKAIVPRRDSNLGQSLLMKLAQKYSIDHDKIWKDLPEWFQHVVLFGDEELIRVNYGGKYVSMYYKGIEEIIKDQYAKGLLTVDFQVMLDMRTCPECNGAKLKKESLNVFLKIQDKKKKSHASGIIHHESKSNIADLQKMPLNELISFVDLYESTTNKDRTLVERILHPLIDRAKTIQDLGLGYLSLHRGMDTLSGGEIQRLRLAKQLGNKLTGIIYVLDEPTIGLDEREIKRAIQAIKKLKEMGNTIIVVEHNEEFIKASDRIVEIGPGAGDFGGKLIFNGPYSEFLKSDCLTAQYILGKKKVHIDFAHRPMNKYISIRKAAKYNLQNIDVKIRLGTFTIITGPSGAGKTTLMYTTLFRFLQEKQKFVQSYIRLQLLKKGWTRQDILAAPVMQKEEYTHYQNLALQEFNKDLAVDTIQGHEEVKNVIYVDQTSIGKTPRSCPATFIGTFDHIRQLFAGTSESKYLGFSASYFSFNSKKGACPACDGYGYKKIELQFLPDTYIPCDLCHGKRYKPEILGIKRRGKSITEILEMYVDDALELFHEIDHIREELELMVNIGLGYLRMGQPAHTLSGGESQRLKLVKHLLKSYKGHTMYFLDEPTVGLHFEDIEKLLKVLREFLNKGDTILMIEHDKNILQFADDIIRLEGGRIVK